MCKHFISNKKSGICNINNLLTLDDCKSFNNALSQIAKKNDQDKFLLKMIVLKKAK